MNRARSRRAGTGGLFVVAALLAGCLVIPAPEHGQVGPRPAFHDDVVGWLRDTQPRREDVLFVLGGPEAHTEDGRKFAYSWARIGGYWAVGGYGAGEAGVIPVRHFLVVTFDEHDRVAGVEESRNSPLGLSGWNRNVFTVLQEEAAAAQPPARRGDSP